MKIALLHSMFKNVFEWLFTVFMCRKIAPVVASQENCRVFMFAYN